MNLCKDCEHLRRYCFIAERGVRTLAGKVLVSDKRGCKRFKPKYEEQGKLLQDEKRGDINA